MPIASLIAGICVTGFVSIWFATTFWELLAKRNSHVDRQVQLSMH